MKKCLTLVYTKYILMYIIQIYKGGENLKAIYMKVQETVWDELDRYSKAMGISKTAIVIIALRQYFIREQKNGLV